jgi:hypothetical protein
MSEFAMADLTGGQLNAIVKKLGGHEGALRFLRDLYVLALPPHISVWKTVRLVGTEEGVDLLVATTKQLTGKNHAELGEIFDAIKLVGELCSVEVAAAVPVQCFDLGQEGKEILRILLEHQEGDDPRGCWVEREGDRISAKTMSAHRGAGAYENDHFVFRVRK